MATPTIALNDSELDGFIGSQPPPRLSVSDSELDALLTPAPKLKEPKLAAPMAAPPVPGMEKLGGTPPGVPAPPLPAELKPFTPPPTAGAFDRERSVSLTPQAERAVQQSDPGGVQFRDLMRKTWKGFTEEVPQGDTPAEAAALGVARAAMGAVSPESLATTLAAGGLGKIFQAAANTPKIAALLENAPAVRKAIDVAASTAIPGAFTVQNLAGAGKAGAAAVEAARRGDTTAATSAAVEAATNLLFAGLGGAGVRSEFKETAGAYPGEQTKTAARPLRPVEQQLAAETGIEPPEQSAGSPRVTPQKAAQKAAELEGSGRSLAAVDWRKLSRGGLGEPIPVDLDGERVTVEPMGRGPTGRPFYRVVGADGRNMYGGTGTAVREFLTQRGARPEAEAPGAPEPTAARAEAATPISDTGIDSILKGEKPNEPTTEPLRVGAAEQPAAGEGAEPRGEPATRPEDRKPELSVPQNTPGAPAAPAAGAAAQAGPDRRTEAEPGKEGVRETVEPKKGDSAELIRGSSNVPLAAQGREEARDLAERTAGQWTKIRSTPLDRGMESANIIAQKNPQAGPVERTGALLPWFLGRHEGQPTEEVLDDINDRIANRPDEPVPGRGPESTGEGESFNDFARRFLSDADQQRENYKPGDKILNMTHYRGIQLLRARRPDGTIDPAVMAERGPQKPGDLYRMDPQSRNVEEVDNADQDGIYYARHGATEWNAEHRGQGETIPAKPETITAETETVPEKAETIQAQIQQLRDGKRRVVMVPSGTPFPNWRQAGRLRQLKEPTGTFLYDTGAISPKEIRSAIAENRLPEILGATQGGLGAPDKSQIAGPPVVVVVRDKTGAEVQAIATDDEHLSDTVEQASKLVPAGGHVSVDTAEEVLAGRVVQSQRGRSGEGRGTGGVPESRRPSNPVGYGGATVIRIPGETRSFDAKYSVRELNDVHPSHNPHSLEPNPTYQFRNDRNYKEPRNAERIIKQVAEFDPAYLVTESPDAVNGPPIIDRNGNVLGGNSRAMTLARVYRDKQQSAQTYRDQVEAKAASFGLNPADFRQMLQPVLVRELTAELSPEEAQRAITDLNKVGTAALLPAERALADAKRVSPAVLDFIAQKIEGHGPEGTLAQALETHGREIVQRLIDDGVVTTAEKGQYINERGLLTDEGKNRISKLMLGRLFDDAASFDRTPPELRNKLERITAPLSRLNPESEWDIAPIVREAIQIIEEARQHKIKNLDDLRAQAGMFGDTSYSPEAFTIAKKLQDGPVKVTAAFRQFTNDAKYAGEPNLLGNAPTASESFNAAFGRDEEAQGRGRGGERGAVAIPQPLASAGRSIGLDKFIQQDVRPRLQVISQGARDILDGLVHMAAPRVGVKRAHLDQVYKLKGDKEKAAYVFEAYTRSMSDALGKKANMAVVNTVAARRTDLTSLGLSPLEAFQVDFIDRIKTGRKQETPELQNIADFLRKIDEGLYNEISKHVDVNYVENHNRVMWKVIPGSKQAQARVSRPGARRPLEGSKGFLKQHKFADMSEGILLGGVPVTYNPVDMFAVHYDDTMRFITAQRWWDAAGKMKARVFVRTGQRAPEGFEKLDDRISKVYFKVPQGLVHGGEWYLDAGVARLMNNYLSRDLLRERGTGLGAAGRAMMAAKNLYTSIELTASGFHFAFITADSAAGSVGLGISKLVNRGLLHGDGKAIAEAFWDVSRGLTVAPAARRNFRLGKAGMALVVDRAGFSQTPEGQWLLKEFPEAADLLDDMFLGGAKLTVNHEYIHNAMRGFREAWKGGNYPGAVLFRGLPAALEAMQHPLFTWYIPRIKVGVFLREYANQLLERKADLDAGRITRAALAREVWDFVEDRFGEMNFDNTFWNRTFKTALQMILRSPTWRLGTWRAAFKAGPAQLAEWSRIFRGEQAPRIVRPETAWMLFGLAFVTALIAEITQYALTKKHVGSVKDAVYPQADPNDENVRLSAPTYLKAYDEMRRKPGEYALSGTSGLLGRAIELYRNRDFYGQKIVNEDDPWYQRQLEMLGHLAPNPISVQSYRRLSEEGSGPAAKLSLVGVTKAPGYVTHTKAEELLNEYQREREPAGSRTKAEAEHSKARALATKEMRAGHGTEAVQEGLAAGTLNRKDVRAIRENAHMTALQQRFKAARLPLGEALNVYEAGSEEEKSQLRPLLIHQLRLAAEKPWESTPEIRSRAEQVLGLGFPASRAAGMR